jgi:hypothetical protein
MHIHHITKSFIFYVFLILFPKVAFSESISYSKEDTADNSNYIVKTNYILSEKDIEYKVSGKSSLSNNHTTEIKAANECPTVLLHEISIDSCKPNSNSLAPVTQGKQTPKVRNNNKAQNLVDLPYDSEYSVVAKADSIGNSLPIDKVNTAIALDQSKPSKLPIVPAGFSKLILESPTSPAAKLIGSDKTILSVSTSAVLATQLLNGLNSDGDFQTGVAFDILPYSLIRGNDLTLEEYRKSGFQRFLANTKFSVATVVASDKARRAALGVEFMLINDSDPRIDMEYQKELNEISEKFITPVAKICLPGKCLEPEERLALLQKIAPSVQEAQKEAKQRLEKKTVWTLGLGQSWVTPSGSYQNLQGEGMGFWTTYRQSIGGNTKLLLHASMRNKERTKQSDGNFANVDTLLGGVRLLSGDDNFRFSLETAYNRESQENNQINNYLSFGVGLEPRIADNTWLSVSFGGSSGRQNGADLQFTTGLKWNFNPGSAGD